MSSIFASRQAELIDRLLPLRPWLGAEAARNIELAQAKTRLICTLAGLCGFAIAAQFVDLPDGIVATAIVFPLYAIFVALHLQRNPAPSRARRALTILVDNLTASWIASFGGGFSSYIGFSFLITMGWGLRFGRHYLFMATGIAILGMGCNLLLSPYWREHYIFGGSIIFALVANAINASILLDRIAAGNRRLAEKMDDIARLAWQDPLTRISNRLYFQERFSQTLASASRNGRQVALLLFDIDGFKAVNDRLGHDAGDRLLVEIAQRVGRRLRQSDSFARFGGDEFVILMDVTRGAGDAVLVAEAVIRAIGEIDLFAAAGLMVSASLGIACCAPQAGEKPNPAELLRQADRAMYEAKRAGKGGYRLAS